MAMLPTPSSWTQRTGLPSRVFGSNGPFSTFGDDGYELYEQDGEFVLSIDVPGFDLEDIDLTWHDKRLTVAAERVDEERDRKRTYHRSFRFPKDIEPDEITASYENGVLEVTLPVMTGGADRGTAITIEG